LDAYISCKIGKEKKDGHVNHNRTTTPHSSVPTLDLSLFSVSLSSSPSLAGLERGLREGGKLGGGDGRDSGVAEATVTPLERAVEETVRPS
jgi:hypothetical protein